MAVNCVSIEKVKEGYIFQVNAPQNHNQPLGVSATCFSSYSECRQAKEAFESLVRKESLQAEDGRFVKIERRDKLYYFSYYDENGICVFVRKAGYNRKANCTKGIKAVFRVISQSKIAD